jgi:hypothetical protein
VVAFGHMYELRFSSGDPNPVGPGRLAPR